MLRNRILPLLISICIVSAFAPYQAEASIDTDANYSGAMSIYNSFLEKMESGYNSDGEWCFDVETFALYDLNADGVPELITHGGGRMDYTKIYTCSEGKISNVHWGSEANIYTNGLIEYSFSSGSGYRLDTFYRMNDRPELEYVYRYAEWLRDDPETFSEGEDAHNEDSDRVDYSVIQQHKAEVIDGASVVQLNYYRNTSTNRKSIFGAYAGARKPTLAAVKITKVVSARKSVTVKWKQISKRNLKKTKKVQIQYSRDKKFRRGVKTKYANAKKTSLKIKGLRSKKKYYVRIRAYARKGRTVHVSKWSAKRSFVAK